MSGEGGVSLLDAVRSGNAERVQAVLKRSDRDELETRAPDGSTPLIFAAFYGNHDIVQALLSHGANPNARDNSGITALTRASVKGHTAIVDMLLDAGADIDAQDNRGATALMGAAARGHLRRQQVIDVAAQ